MVVYFSKQKSNYNQQNIIDILSVINNPLITSLMHSPYDYINIVGDIHRSQWTSDNPKNYFWLKIQGFIDDMPVPELKAAHIYVCFSQYILDYKTGQYIMGNCINPEGKTDVADISNLMGFWQFKKITYGLSPKVAPRKTTKLKRRRSSALKIIDPKTGKPIQIGKVKKSKTGKSIQIGKGKDKLTKGRKKTKTLKKKSIKSKINLNKKGKKVIKRK